MNTKAEIDLLNQFLDSTDKTEIANLAILLNQSMPIYHREISEERTRFYINEQVTPLEFAAEEGKLDQLNALLETKPSFRSPRHKQGILNNEDHNHIECAACFRALKNGHYDIVLRLLERPEASSGILDIDVSRQKTAFKNQPYLNYISRSGHYPFSLNDLVIRGNVALLIAAGLPDARIFNKLLEIPPLKAQLPRAAIPAFLNATRTPEGLPKHQINTEIVHELLKLESVYRYACSREFDFKDIIAAFDLKSRPAAAMQGPSSFAYILSEMHPIESKFSPSSDKELATISVSSLKCGSSEPTSAVTECTDRETGFSSECSHLADPSPFSH